MEYAAGQTQQSVLRNLQGGFQAVQGDRLTGALGAIDPASMMAHSGRHFTVPDSDSAVLIASPKEWLIVTPDNDDLEVHALLKLAASGGCTIELFEGATTSADGTEITPVNNRRESTYESEVAAYYDPTVTGAGVRIDIDGLGSAGGQSVLGEPVLDLKANTKYLIRVTVTADNTVVSLAGKYAEFDADETEFSDSSSSA